MSKPILGCLMRVSGDTSSEKAFKLAKRWLSSCLDKHERCRRQDDSNRENMPTRLVDVSPIYGDVRLVETREMTSPAPYICLSHCWGDASKQVTTTRLTLEERKYGMAWDALPQLFKDIITSVRRLGVNYLWIDSLCIIQDDPEDWKQESTRMCIVYQNSLLTIAATKCADSSESLFSKSSSALAFGISTLFRRPGMRAQNGQFSELHGHFRWPYPLLSRAWIYQERLLSKRVLHFGEGEIYWECMESAECECGLVARSSFGPLPESRFPYKNVHDRMPKRITIVPEIVDMNVSQWHDIVTEYTSLSMTLISDRLPAILGLAQEIQSHRDGRYIAGLWEDSLISDLAWAVSQYGVEKSRPFKSVTLAPSWSWASIGTGCFYSGSISSTEGLERPSQLLSIQYPDPSNFPTDPKALGCITLRGKLAPVLVSAFRKYPNSVEVISAIGKSERKAYYRPDYDHSTNGEYYVPPNEIVYFLYLGSHSRVVREPLETWFDLVLRCIDPSNQLYERIGSNYSGFDSSSEMQKAIQIYKECPEVVINLV
ncbi:HET-domain-containing protein [Hyaloscypha variabilis F]|uniref:HET-domain-containing protein n=1 Tax=Hyaloscypha variabilis (strain UAMH 11265 / GT02V1 / F) TaxID=1149755 RepID=A0A2J6QZ06_HYAVF|nr:HET-domain-containing protein [Hyaloscypha variabilis F]